jgi:hypothetical protein
MKHSHRIPAADALRQIEETEAILPADDAGQKIASIDLALSHGLTPAETRRLLGIAPDAPLSLDTKTPPVKPEPV